MPEKTKGNPNGLDKRKESTRALIIHDNEGSRVALSDLLESININPENISVAGSVSEAYNIINSSRYKIDIILWKYDLGGTGFIRTIGEANEGKPYSLLITGNKVFQPEDGNVSDIYLDKEFIEKLQEYLTPSEAAKPVSEPTHILIVHSDPAVREEIKKMLLKHHVPEEKIHFADKPDGDGLEKAMESRIDTIEKGNEIIQRREQIALLFVENTKSGAELAEQLVTDPTYHPYITVVAKGKNVDGSWEDDKWKIDRLEMTTEKSAHDLAEDEEEKDQGKETIAVIDEKMIRTLVGPESAESNVYIADSEQVNADIQKVIKNAKSHLISKEHRLFIESSRMAIKESADHLAEDTEEGDEIDEEDEDGNNGLLGMDDELISEKDKGTNDFEDDTKTPAIEKDKNGQVKGLIITPGDSEYYYCFYEQARQLPTLIRRGPNFNSTMAIAEDKKYLLSDEKVGSVDADGTVTEAYTMFRLIKEMGTNNFLNKLFSKFPPEERKRRLYEYEVIINMINEIENRKRKVIPKSCKESEDEELIRRSAGLAQRLMMSLPSAQKKKMRLESKEFAEIKRIIESRKPNKPNIRGEYFLEIESSENYEEMLRRMIHKFSEFLQGCSVHEFCKFSHAVAQRDFNSDAKYSYALPAFKYFRFIGMLATLATGMPAEMLGPYRTGFGIKDRCYPLEQEVRGTGGDMVYTGRVAFYGGFGEDKMKIAQSISENNFYYFHIGDQPSDFGPMSIAINTTKRKKGAYGKGFVLVDKNTQEARRISEELSRKFEFEEPRNHVITIARPKTPKAFLELVNSSLRETAIWRDKKNKSGQKKSDNLRTHLDYFNNNPWDLEQFYNPGYWQTATADESDEDQF